ncbi:hypothetical protein XA3_02540 [Xylocopilactobacillus apicola]|uniref:Uncharacterized protein n=1 Tax=Xylocopilactobacillus apicola TaxID=2932184 RepID=A0AAU9DVA7_9LACO|nr:hypothetical protein XA3_02540 [Xylocopilactobacillus apicola]
MLKKLGYLLTILSGIWALSFAMSFKEDDKAANFPEHVAQPTDASDFRGGAVR